MQIFFNIRERGEEEAENKLGGGGVANDDGRTVAGFVPQNDNDAFFFFFNKRWRNRNGRISDSVVPGSWNVFGSESESHSASYRRRGNLEPARPCR